MIDYKREAERLRIVLQTFAYAHPDMTLDEAVPLIFQAEKRTAELESSRATTTTDTGLSLTPQALAEWIDARKYIVGTLRGSDQAKKIYAIREVRLTHPSRPGLHEAKKAVEYWQNHYE